MGWGFFWLMVVLKVPIAALLYIVWWAIKSTDVDGTTETGDGGVKPSPHRPRVPRRPRRRGPHGSPGAATVLPRVRTPLPTARARSQRHGQHHP